MKQKKYPIPFTPTFCPNPKCKFHLGAIHFYKLNGYAKTKKAPFFNQRYRCKSCEHQFSYNTFQLDFRKRKPDLSKSIFQMSMNGMTNCSIARLLKVRERVVRNRLALLSRQAQLFNNELEKNLKIKEPVCYDGFETFSGSQFSPCYVNTVVGKSSLYTFLATFSPLNRKGQMTAWQKRKNIYLQEKFGKYPSNSVFKLTDYTYKKLISISGDSSLILHTDEHKTYDYLLKSKYNHQFIHIKTNSKERRDKKNPLFPVNHLHLTYRHFLASQRRETIAFNKNEAGLMDRMMLMKVYKNVMRPKTLRMRRLEIGSPAMDLELCDKILNFEEVFSKRRLRSHYELDSIEEQIYTRDYSYSRQKIERYSGN